jgi:hypothetical protein
MPDVRHRDPKDADHLGRGSQGRSANLGASLACHHPGAAESDDRSATAADHPGAAESGGLLEKSADPEAGQTDAAASGPVAERERSGQHHERQARSADPEADQRGGAACPRGARRARLLLDHGCSRSHRSDAPRARLRDESRPSESKPPVTRAAQPEQPVRLALRPVPGSPPKQRPEHQPGPGPRQQCSVPTERGFRRPGLESTPQPQRVQAYESQWAAPVQRRELALAWPREQRLLVQPGRPPRREAAERP